MRSWGCRFRSVPCWRSLAVGAIALARPAARPEARRHAHHRAARPIPVSLDPHLETTAPGAWVYFNMLEPLV